MAKSYDDLVREALRVVPEVDCAQARAIFDAQEGTVFLDVREPEEVYRGTIPGALPIPRGVLEGHIEDALPDRDATIVILCATGKRSALAGKTLQEMGYPKVSNLAGGFVAWAKGGHPVGRPQAY
jgi:adenylyltransferase/sulfurtransferase